MPDYFEGIDKTNFSVTKAALGLYTRFIFIFLHTIDTCDEDDDG